MNIKFLIIVFFCVTSSQGINYDALEKCTDRFGGEGVTCNGNCYLAVTWCNFLTPRYCSDSGVMTNDLELCANDEFWKPINQSYPPEEVHKDKFLQILNSDFPTENYEALVPCSVMGENDGMMCGGSCLPSYYWCNDKFEKMCLDSGVMTNSILCWGDGVHGVNWFSNLTCDIDLVGLQMVDGKLEPFNGTTHYPGERCKCTGWTIETGTPNYCFYPDGKPEVLSGKDKFIARTTCDCVSNPPYFFIIPVILVIAMIAAVGGGVYYCKKKQQQATQESEMGKM